MAPAHAGAFLLPKHDMQHQWRGAKPMYSIRDAGTDRKRWVIEREGYHFAVAAFHDRADAERYLAKLLSRTQHAA